MIGLFLNGSRLPAQNPIAPPGVYLADPSAHVWDGRLYVYGSRDESPDYWCSWSYDILSTKDLKQWTLDTNVFRSRGVDDAVPYSDSALYAPDCQRIGDTYYLYYCLANKTTTEGVATSKSPTGPFSDARVIDVGKRNQIDPCVFIDDDGTGYYIWGQISAKIAKLKPGNLEIDPTTIRDGILTEKEHYFHEGSYMVKRNGIYYFIFADISRGGKPTCLGYATSTSPMGPFTYRGVIIDNNYCDPGNWNNHGSLAEFDGRWYVFYHRSTHGSQMMRKACLEPITFNEDGTIPEVEMTSQGAAPSLDAFAEIDAARACLLYGNVRIKAVAPDNEALSDIQHKDQAAYKYIDFGAGAESFSIQVAPGKTGGRIEVSLDQSWRRPIAALDVPGGGDGQTWTVLTGSMPVTRGTHAVWLRFVGEPNAPLYKVDWLKFHHEPRL